MNLALQNGRNDCGGNVFKAATDHAARLKKQDERGLTMLCCRHGCVLRAVNMFKGETYRHIHYLHKFAFEKNCKFLCYDVVCQYWLWARKVGDTLGHKYEDFKSMTTLMFPFLSRMHAIAHVWYCYVSISLVYLIIFRYFNLEFYAVDSVGWPLAIWCRRNHRRGNGTSKFDNVATWKRYQTYDTSR